MYFFGDAIVVVEPRATEDPESSPGGSCRAQRMTTRDSSLPEAFVETAGSGGVYFQLVKETR